MESKSLKYWKTLGLVMMVLNIVLWLFLFLKPFDNKQMHPAGKEQGGPGKFIIEKLQFSKEQIVAFDELRTAHHDSVEKLRFHGKQLRETLFSALQNDTTMIDKNLIATQIAENQKLIELVTYDHFAEVKKLCTTKQKIIFNEIIQEVLESMMPHKEPPQPPEQN